MPAVPDMTPLLAGTVALVTGAAADSPGMVKLQADDIADAVLYMVTRDRRVSVNQMLVRAAEQTW